MKRREAQMGETSAKDWSTGLCGWCTNIDDCEFCCLATCCGCIAYGMNTALMRGHRGYSECCCGKWPQSCEYQYCGDACCLYMYISNSRQLFDNNTFSPNNPVELILGLLCGCVSACVTNAFIGFLTYKQVEAVGKGRKIYKDDHIPMVCCGCDEACCESFWCGPCVLTRVHHEVLKDFDENRDNAKKYEYNLGTFKQVNSMFESVKIK